MSYAGAIERLLSLVRPETSPARRHAMAQAGVLRLLHGLDDPHQSLAVVHVAGSKGKGSTAHYIEAVLRGCGLRTGLYTSPHLVDWTERIRIDGAPVTEQAFADALDDVWTVLLRETPTGGAHADVASFFDVLTAAACHEFARRGVQVAVVECGLGGRFDATNVFASRVGIITTLELEHTDRLGQRIESIAWHKAGIARRDRPLLIGPMPENARRVVSMEARAVGARLHDQREFIASPPRVCDTNILLDYQHAGLRLDVRLPGPALHAAENACLALAAAHLGELVDPASLRTHAAAALAGCQPPGRLQLFPGPPRLLVDAAHAEGSAR
ncbi:MAG: hypothetical protein KDK91_01520, partial [Gammaproteobacteria bacterium]|nr:hypothetical protein [Gammaproteobacteria bacterium]